MNENEKKIKSGWRSICHGIHDLSQGLWWVTCNVVARLARAVNGLVHRFPWTVILLEAVLFMTVCCWQIGKARAERDRYSHRAYIYEVSNDSLKTLVDSFILH